MIDIIFDRIDCAAVKCYLLQIVTSFWLMSLPYAFHSDLLCSYIPLSLFMHDDVNEEIRGSHSLFSKN